MDSQCRLCTENTSNSTSIFAFHKNRLILDLISLLCPIKIDPADEYPKEVCQRCLKALFDAQELREKSVRSDIKFRTKKFSPQIIEAVSIKEEDPIQPAIVFENDTMDQDMDFEPSSSDSDDSDFKPYFPIKPSSKYEVINNRYKCPNCHKTFTNSQNVSRHIRGDHANEEINYVQQNIQVDVEEGSSDVKEKEKRAFTCHICGMTFNFYQSLQRHVKNIHPGEKELTN